MQIQLDTKLLRRLRHELHLSQEEFSSLSGISLRTVQRAEGSGFVSIETARAIASALETDISALESQHSKTTKTGLNDKMRYGVLFGILGAFMGLAGAMLGYAFAIDADLSLSGLIALNKDTGFAYGLAGLILGLIFSATGIAFGIQHRR